jgi:dienelactone hydrolase
MLVFSGWVNAELQTEEIEYQVSGQDFVGYLAYDDEFEGERPGILLVHEWWGHNDYVRQRADMLAELGYTAFALDMYGSGKTAEHPEQAQEFMQAVMSNMDAAEKRFTKALELLRNHQTVDPEQTAAMGWCFGGGVVLHMARAGVDLDAVLSYHGMLATENPAEAGDIQAKVRVFTGGADPMVPKAQVKDFKQEMRAAEADFKVYSYPKAEHSFTNPEADQKAEKFDMPIGYNAKADADSWEKTVKFLDKLFE